MARGRQAWIGILALVLAGSAAPGGAAQATVPAGFTDSLVTTVGAPTAIAFAPDGRLLITTQPGRLRIYKAGGLLPTPALDLTARICANSERGLLGIAVDPAFASNRFIYVYWTASGAACTNRVSRFTLGDDDLVDPASELTLIANIHSTAGNHNGGDLQFGKDGHLYVSVGDGGCDYAAGGGCAGANDAARDEHVLLGKILRITPGGGIPADNPHQGAGTARCNVTGQTTPGNKCQETYARGLRNPFRIAFDPNAAGTRFFINDVGQNRWEEIDLGQAGADYGWNVREGHCANGSLTDCGPPPAGMTNPIYDYNRSAGCGSITGGAFVPVGSWPVEYDGDYLFGDFVCGRIFRLEPSVGGGYAASDFATGLGSSSAVSMAFGPSGVTRALYYTTYAGGGSVRSIAFTGSANRAPVAAITTNPGCACGTAPLTVSFDASGSRDADGDPLTYAWDLDADGAFDDSTAVAPSREYPNGTHLVRLQVSDGRGGSDIESVTVNSGNTAPSPTIIAPSTEHRFRVGETLVLRGSATDAQDGQLSGTSLSWRVFRHHGATHTHPWLPPTAGSSVSIETPSPEDLQTVETSYLEVELTATDSGGLTTSVSRNILPNVVDLTFVTRPAGLALTVAGESLRAPRTVSSWQGFGLSLDTEWQRDRRGLPFAFAAWSDGGARKHVLTTPAADLTVTARFEPAVQVDAIRYDPPGRRLNAEWMRLRNVGGRPVSLAGWRVRDSDGHTYRLGRFKLKVGRTVTIHTGRGRNTTSHRYWGRRGFVWDDGGDRASLRAGSFVADSCGYRRTAAGLTRCRD